MRKLFKTLIDHFKLIMGCEGGFWPALAIGAGAGLLKHELVDKPQHKRMQEAQAEITRHSPWTGMQGKTLTPPSAFGSMMQGGMTGAMMGQMAGGGGAGAMTGHQQAAQNGAGGFWNRLSGQGVYSKPTGDGVGPYLPR